MKRIVAIGGGGFMMEEGPSALDEYVIGLARSQRPRICFISTASGDAEKHLAKYYADFSRFGAQLSHLAFFRKALPGAIAFDNIERRLCEQDVIYVGGGNTRSMLAVWREWGVPQALRNALAGGTVLAGVSAGAICWFEWGASDSAAPAARSAPLRCLGFLKGSCSPHWGGEPHRRRDFHGMIRRGEAPAGYGICDGAALLFEDARLAEVVSIDHAACAFRVERSGDRLCETRLPARLIAAPGRSSGPRASLHPHSYTKERLS
jgi:peptidase E